MNIMIHESTAVTAAFVMEGMLAAGLREAMQNWDIGGIEIISDVMEYVPAILAIRDAADKLLVGADYPGVFEYEVCDPIGKWMGSQLFHHGELPARSVVVGFIAATCRTFYSHPCHNVSFALIRTVIANAAEAQLEEPTHG